MSNDGDDETKSRRPNRDRIIATAAKHFLRFGFENTTFATIAQEVGIWQPAINNFFDSKMHLLKAVCHASAKAGRISIDSRVNPTGKAPNATARMHRRQPNFFRKSPRPRSFADDALLLCGRRPVSEKNI